MGKNIIQYERGSYYKGGIFMKNALVFQSDFGIGDGAVSAMYGVAYNVDNTLQLFDLTHEIPQYNICEASYRLIQTVVYLGGFI